MEGNACACGIHRSDVHGRGADVQKAFRSVMRAVCGEIIAEREI